MAENDISSSSESSSSGDFNIWGKPNDKSISEKDEEESKTSHSE